MTGLFLTYGFLIFLFLFIIVVVPVLTIHTISVSGILKAHSEAKRTLILFALFIILLLITIGLIHIYSTKALGWLFLYVLINMKVYFYILMNRKFIDLTKRFNFIKQLVNNPKQVALIDAFGALTTALLLLGVLAQWEDNFGIPSSSLYVLAGIAFGLFIFSLTCHTVIRKKWKTYLLIIMSLNLLYSLISMLFVLHHLGTISLLGLVYFLLELFVIAVIVLLEFRTYKNSDNN